MGISTQYVSVDITKKTAPQIIRLGQGDKNGTTIAAKIYNDGAEYSMSGKTARFCMRTPDGKASYSVNSSSTSGNSVSFNINEQYAASVAGKTDVAYIEVLSGSTVICSTSRISVVVYRSASEGLPVSGAYSDALEEAIHSASTAASSANSAASNANTKATRAENAATAASNAAQSANAAKDAANAAASAATTAAGSATTAAEAATSAKDAANAAATAANTAAGSANAATSEANAAIEAMGDISELAVPLMSADTRGGAKLGSGLAVSDGALSVSPIPDASIDSVASGDSQAGAQSLSLTGLSRLWAKMRSAFAAMSHVHSADDVTSGTLPVARGGTGVSTAAAERERLGLGSTTGALPIANGGTGASNAADARTALGLGSLATRSSLDLVSLAEDGSAVDSSARSSGANYRIDITLEPMSGYKPIAVIAVSADSANARLRGFDLDGISTGGTPKVKTYWNASGDMSANTVTYNVQVLMMKTTLP